MAKKPDTLQTHQQRWREAKEHREYWDREARKDLRFSVGKVWDAEEIEQFIREGRECTSFDLIRPVLKLIAGTEALNRRDTKVLPRSESDTSTSEALTKISKFIADQNNGGRQYSNAFWDGIVLGIGWMEVGFSPDPYAEQNQFKRVDPFDIWVDPASRELDLSDALDLFRAVWIRPDDLAEMFPKHKRQILGLVNRREEYEENASWDFSSGKSMSHTADYTNKTGDRPPVWRWDHDSDFGGVDTHKKMIRAVERWYKQREMATFVRYRDGMVREVSNDNILEVTPAIINEGAQVFRAMATRVRVAIFAGDMLLQDSESPYSHNQFPFVPMWCDWDEWGRPMGLVRGLRDPAKEFNARRTMALKKALSRQVIYEQGSFPNVDQAARQFGRNNAFIATTPGAVSGNKIEVRDDLQSSAVEMDLLAQSRQMIQDVSGATQELMGRETNAQSGRAIEARQAQGQATLYTIFDLRNWCQRQVGTLLLANVQDTYTGEQSFRITESMSGLGWVKINSPQPDGTILNDVSQGRYDVIVDDGPFSETERLAAAEEMSEFLNGLPPEIKLMFAQEVAKLRNLPEDFVEKLGMVIEGMLGAAPAEPSMGDPASTQGGNPSRPPLVGGPVMGPQALPLPLNQANPRIPDAQNRMQGAAE